MSIKSTIAAVAATPLLFSGAAFAGPYVNLEATGSYPDGAYSSGGLEAQIGYEGATENGIGWTATNAGIYSPTTSISSPLDGNYLLNYNSRVGGIERTDGDEFTFVSVAIQGDSRYSVSTDVQFRAYKNGSMVQDETRNISTSEWIIQTFNWSDIDKYTWDPINPSTSNVAQDNLIYIP